MLVALKVLNFDEICLHNSIVTIYTVGRKYWNVTFNSVKFYIVTCNANTIGKKQENKRNEKYKIHIKH